MASTLLFIPATLMALGQAPVDKADVGRAPPRVLEVTIDKAITNAMKDYLVAALTHANDTKVSAVLVRLDTPGGLLDTTRDMVQEVLNADVPVVVFVSPKGARAASAGMFLTLAAHVAAMAPGTDIGAAHPVGPFGGNVEGDMRDKVVNETVAWCRSLAETHGRNMDWVEKAVRESSSIPAQEALEKKVVDLVAEDVPALLRAVHGREVTVRNKKVMLETAGAQVEAFPMSGRQIVATFLANPDLIYFLFLVGLFLLFLEFKSPGLIVPGVVGALCLALVLGVQVLPVNWVGVILILGAAALFVAEIYVTSFGLLAVGGIVCLVLGSYLLFDVPGSTLRVAPVVIWTVALTFAAILVGVGTLLLRAKTQGATSGVDAMAGEEAEVFEAIAPGQIGKIFARGSYWSASSSELVPPGTRVRIRKMVGLKAEVEPIKS